MARRINQIPVHVGWREVHGQSRLCHLKGSGPDAPIKFVVTMTLEQFVAREAVMFLCSKQRVLKISFDEVVAFLQNQMADPGEPTDFLRHLIKELDTARRRPSAANGALEKLIVGSDTNLRRLTDVAWDEELRSLIDAEPHYLYRLLEKDGYFSAF